MTTFEQVKKIVSDKLGVPEEKIEENSSFVNDLGADSLDVVEFVMEVEKQFNISIPDEDATKLETVGKAVEYIDAHKNNISGFMFRNVESAVFANIAGGFFSVRA